MAKMRLPTALAKPIAPSQIVDYNVALQITNHRKNRRVTEEGYTLGRSLVASWLNFLAGNSAPTSDINSGITWLQQHTPDENVPANGVGDGNLTLQASAYAVPASSAAWSGVGSGETINAALDYYNNTGLFGSQPI